LWIVFWFWQILLKNHLFCHRSKQDLLGHQTPTQIALTDCKASYEVSVFEEVALQHSKRVFRIGTEQNYKSHNSLPKRTSLFDMSGDWMQAKLDGRRPLD
jgi:hypothetical protein